MERVARERVGALEDLGRVAQRIGLADGRWPTQAQYEALREELGSAATKVAELWKGRWRQALEHFTGRGAQESERCSGVRRRVATQAWRDPAGREATALAGIRRWLDTDPPSRTARAYQRWARARSGEPEPPYSYTGVLDVLGVYWPEALAVAAGETT